MVFYRKYRPQKIEELDSEEVRNKLYSVFSKKVHSHAFLFTGPKGLGKTSTARIVAKIINCERLVDKRLAAFSSKGKKDAKSYTLNADVEPCNTCEQCVSITNGTNLDVLEIDGASNRGIDEIRDLREKIRLSPLKAEKKVYIIDEVHMLTTEAFNALLKTLEEPPIHAVFILCTTEPQKVPSTILSRCSHLLFNVAKKEELIRSFSRITHDEKIAIDKEALDFIASLSDGSFRDGAKLLEELVLISNGQKITKEIVEEKYQISNIKSQISNLINFLEKKDTKSSLRLVSELVKQGTNFKYFIEQLINELHDYFLKLVEVNNKGEVSDSVKGFTIQETKELIELLIKAHQEFKYSVLPQLSLEIAILEWGQEQTQNKTEQNAEQNGKKILSSSGLANDKKKDIETERSDNKQIWLKLIEQIKNHNHSVAGVLRGCEMKEFDVKNKKFIIEAKYKFHKDKLEERKTRDLIEKAIEELTGNSTKVSVMLKDKK